MLLTLTASDSSTGAGALADIQVAQQLAIPCQAVLIAVTAQTNDAALAAYPLPLDIITSQYQAATATEQPQVIRLGWLPFNEEFLSWLVESLNKTSALVLFDPVLAASQGSALSQPEANARVTDLFKQLLARVDLLTPNYQEAQQLSRWLLGKEIADEQELAKQLQTLGKFHLLITGVSYSSTRANDLIPAGYVADYFAFNSANPLGSQKLPNSSLLQEFYFTHKTVKASKHGTGCHLISQLAGRLIRGETLYDALIQAVAATRSFLLNQPSDFYSNNFYPSRFYPTYLPSLLAPAKPPPAAAFQSLTQALGLYGLVDDLAHLKRLLALGIDSLQWRVKNPTTDYVATTQAAVEACRAAQVPLFINDDWRLAIQLNAYGVHLGQEDLATADLAAIQAAGLRLGISTHSDWEIARAASLKPSYLAIGPVFAPLSKQLTYAPLGTATLSRLMSYFPDASFTCIGGITEENAAQVWATGVPSIAIVTALADTPELANKFKQLQEAKNA